MKVKAIINKIHSGDVTTLAYATITIDEAVAIHSVCIVKNKDGNLVMSMPAFERTQRDGQVRRIPICHPISFSARKKMEEALFKAYYAELAKIQLSQNHKN